MSKSPFSVVPLRRVAKSASLAFGKAVRRTRTMRLNAVEIITRVLRVCFIALAIVMSGAVGMAQAQGGSHDALRIVSFGTSLSAKGGWQAPLSSSLANCLGRPVEVIDHSGVGETSRWGLSEVARVAGLDPDIVLIEFAINDAMITRWVLPFQSVSYLTELVERLRAANPDVRIYLQEMNPAWGMRAWARPLLGNYLASHRALATRLGLGFIDHSPFWSGFSGPELQNAIPDGVHPDPEQVANDIATTITQALVSDLGGASGCAAAKAVD